MEKPKKITKENSKATKGRVTSMYALPYMGCMVYLVRYDDLFVSMAVIDGQMHHFYLEVPVKEGKKSHSRKDLDRIIQILLAGAHTTIEHLRGVVQSEREAGQAQEVLDVMDKTFGPGGSMA